MGDETLTTVITTDRDTKTIQETSMWSASQAAIQDPMGLLVRFYRVGILKIHPAKLTVWDMLMLIGVLEHAIADSQEQIKRRESAMIEECEKLGNNPTFEALLTNEAINRHCQLFAYRDTLAALHALVSSRLVAEGLDA